MVGKELILYYYCHVVATSTFFRSEYDSLLNKEYLMRLSSLSSISLLSASREMSLRMCNVSAMFTGGGEETLPWQHCVCG